MRPQVSKFCRVTLPALLPSCSAPTQRFLHLNNPDRSSSLSSNPKTITKQQLPHASAIAPLLIPARNFHSSNPLYTSPNDSNENTSTSSSSSSPPESLGFWDRLAKKHGEHSVYAPDDYNRWKIVPLAVSSHLCLGACYAWSIFNEPLTRELGVVAPSASDWVLSDVVYTFMAIIVAQGTAMAVGGRWVEKVGARIAGITGSVAYGTGMILGATGVYMHNLPLMITGYGIIGGSGMGIAYLPPVATLLRWFPDKRGLATGMAICGFGGGAIFIAGIKKNLLQYFFESPTYVGTLDTIETKRDTGGKLLANVDNIWQEVLNVTNTEMTNIGLKGLEEGLYLVNTGNTGVAATMGTLGLGYLAICATSATLLKVPKPGWKPEEMIKKEEEEKKLIEQGKMKPKQDAVTQYVELNDVMRTPQFWLMWTTFLSTATAGMGLMSCAKDVLAACFANSPAALAVGPSVFAATYVQILSAANLGGRFVWASASDKLGRKNTFIAFGALGIPLYFALPWIVASALDMQLSNGPLFLFYGSTFLIVSMFGGGYSTIPAYESDLFGTKYITSIHGRMFTASALSGIIGPTVFSRWHAIEEKKAILNLTEIANTPGFIEKFGVSKDNIDKLIENKTVNIPKLLELCPNGTMDPTPFLYDPAFKTMGIVMGIGALANLAIKPVDPKLIKSG